MEMKLKNSGAGEAAKAKTEPWMKPKNGSVFPKKRKLVKRMIFDEPVQSIASLFTSSSSKHQNRVPAEMEMEMKMENSGPDEVVKAKTGPWMKPKNGSVFPKQRKLVKRMIFDELVQSIASLFSFSSSKHQNRVSCSKITPEVSNAD